MTLDLGQLVAELKMDISPLESALKRGDMVIDQFMIQGKKAAERGGVELGEAAGDGFNRLPPKVQRAVDESVGIVRGERDHLQVVGAELGDAAGKGFSSKLEDELQGTGAKAEDAGQEAGHRFSESITKGVKAVGALIGTGISVGIVDNLNLDAGRARLAAQLDLTKPQMQAAGKIAGEIYADNFGDSADQINDAISLIVRNTDLTLNSVDLKPVTEKVLGLADVYDQDLGGTVNAVSQLMRTGLAKNAGDALDVIAVGLKNVNKSDDLLDTINEYSTQFRALGLSGPQALGLLQQALKGGARDADTAADALKEFALQTQGNLEQTNSKGVRSLTGLGQAFSDVGIISIPKMYKAQETLAAGGPKAAAVLDRMLDGLRAIKDPAEHSRVAVGLFNTKSEDMQKALGSLDVTTAVDGLGKVAGAADRVNEKANAHTQATIEGYRRQLTQMGRNAIESVGPLAAAAAAVSLVGPAALQVLGPIAQLIVARRVARGAAEADAVAETAASASTVRSWLAAGASAVAGGVRVAGAWAATAARTAVSWVVMSAQAIASTAVTVATVVGGWILMGTQALLGAARMAAAWIIAMGPIGLAIALIAGVVFLVVKHWDDIKAATTAAWDWVVGKVQAVGGAIVDFFTRWTIAGIIISHWQQIKTGVSTKVDELVAFVRGIPERTVSALGDLGGLLKAKGTSLIGGLISGVTGMLTGKGSLGDTIGDIPGKVVSKIGDLGGLLKDAGVAIVQGLIDGIVAKFQALKDKVGELSNWVKDHKGPESYDRVMWRPAGGWIVSGLINGLDDAMPDLKAKVADVNALLVAGAGAGLTLSPVITPGGPGDTGAPPNGGPPPVAAGGSTNTHYWEINGASDPEASAKAVARRLALAGIG